VIITLRRRQRVRDRHADLDHSLVGKLLIGLERDVERLAVDELHDQEADASDLFYRMECDNVGVVEPGDHFRFTEEAFQAGGVFRHIAGQDLERDIAVELRVPGPVDLAHTAPSDERDNLVVSQGAADHTLF
jgi:hypothetical protein